MSVSERPGDMAAGGPPSADTPKPRDCRQRLWALISRVGPLVVAAISLVLGYLHYAPGAAYSLSNERYRAWAFPAFRYSDLIWLYLRDGLDRRPVPYLDYPLEYPPLTGLLSWLASWTPDLPAYFALVYLLLAASALATVWALQWIGGANPWLFAASPALFFYTGHQWDMVAVGVTALSLLALQRRRDALGIAGLVVATSLKLFPVVFAGALVIERLRDRRFRSAAGIAAGFTLGTLAINLPMALVNVANWSFFIRWNRDRLADSGIWVLWRDAPTADLTRWSLVAALTGGIAITVVALRARGPLVIPLGATYLLWWLMVNKTFTTHLILWAILSLALLSVPWWLWGLVTAVDIAGFQLGNYLNLYNVPDYRSAPLIRKAVENIYDPLQLARTAVLLVATFWGLHLLRSPAMRAAYAPRRGPRRPAPPRPPTHTAAHETGVWRRRPLADLAAAILFLGATLLMTWPYPRHLGDVTIVGFDPFLQIWLAEWIRHALATAPASLYQANIFYPFALTLAYTDANIPGALLAAPLRLATGDPILTNSLLVLLSFVMAAGGVYALVCYLTGNRGAAIAAGLAYAFLPYRMVHLWHLNWLEGALLPWVILAFLALVDRPSLRRALLLGLLSAALVLISFYFSIQVILVFGILLGMRSLSVHRPPSLAVVKALAAAAALFALIAVPLYLPYLQVRDEQQLERTLVDAEQYKALPESYLQLAPWDTPHPLQRLLGVRAGPNESLTEVGQAPHADGHQHAEIVIEDALFPGFVAFVFALIGLATWRRPRWLAAALAAIAVVAAILSLGPSWGARHGDGPGLPYGWLFDHAPLFRAMRVPARLGGLVDLAIVLLAGLGVAAVWERAQANHRLGGLAARKSTGAALTGLLAFAIVAELWTGPIPIEQVDRGPVASAAATWLATQSQGPVMEFPAESVFADPAAASVRRHYGEAMFWSTIDWNPRVNGNSGFIPRAYSDFIERFVGEIPRPDGTLTPRISHLDAGTARLLRQIGVRYLFFHRDQYREEDWPAIAAELDRLAESGIISRAGQHGDVAVYLLAPSLPPEEPPDISLYAPTLMTPGADWAPWIAVESPEGMPSVLALTEPARLETTWYDAAGRQLWRGVERIPLPAVLDDPALLCSTAECLTSRPLTDPPRLPPPETEGGWQPVELGHYVVRLRLLGERELECRVDLDLVKNADEVWQRSRDEAFRWARCVSGHPNPVNDPGAPPFRLSPPSITLVGETAAVDIGLTPRRDEEVRGWFILAPPGSAEPWNEAVYQSRVQQRIVSAGEAASFAWQERVGAQVEPGVYGLSVWFHRRADAGWEHAAGGDLDLAPVVVGEDHALRWAGPIRARLAARPGPFLPGRTTALALDVTGVSDRSACEAEWRLFRDAVEVANGDAASCDAPEITLPATVVPGRHRLQIDLYAVKEGERQLSDAVSIPVPVTATDTHRGPS
ncbi:MAG: hypothetical protein IT338_05065 [Thermomicrobiales bacterium]|nr:hypothetical protein [Thermomicrobiales bacterium]